MRRIILSLIALSFFSGIADAEQWAFLRYREHATNCQSLVDGGYYDVCRQLSDNTWYACYPSDGVNGVCDTASEWQLISANAGAWSVLNGNIYNTDFNSKVGIGTFTPNSELDVNGIANASQNVTVNNDPVCRLSGTNCPAPIFFNANNYGNVDSWGIGNSFHWTFNSGATDPVLTFGDALISIDDAALRIHGTTSRIKFGNSMYIAGNESRKMCWSSLTGTYNEDLCWSNDEVPNKWTITSTTGTTAIDWGVIGTQNTSLTNNFGAVSIGTFGTGASVATITGNVSIGTSNFNTAAPTNGILSQGDVYVNTNGKGIVYKKPDGSCCRTTADNTNALTCSPITCP